jgi:hypothetical protein
MELSLQLDPSAIELAVELAATKVAIAKFKSVVMESYDKAFVVSVPDEAGLAVVYIRERSEEEAGALGPYEDLWLATICGETYRYSSGEFHLWVPTLAAKPEMKEAC